MKAGYVVTGGLRAWSMLLLALAVLSPAHGSATDGDDRLLAVSQAAVGNEVSDHVLFDSAGRVVTLGSLRGRPLVVSLVYTSCYGSCNVLTRRLARAVDVARDTVGKNRFAVVTVGFDAANDTPSRMAAYAGRQNIGDDSWQVLSASDATARALARELGFSFEPSPRGFDHISQVTIVDAAGRVYRQVYGEAFPTPALVEPLKELIWGTAARAATFQGWVSGLKLLCTVYDPSQDRYRFDYSVVVAAITGALCLGGVAVFVVRAWHAGEHTRAG